jgi:hypothetical protein
VQLLLKSCYWNKTLREENIFQGNPVYLVDNRAGLPKIGCGKWVWRRKISYDRHHLALHYHALFAVDGSRSNDIRYIIRFHFLKTVPDELNAVCCGGSI